MSSSTSSLATTVYSIDFARRNQIEWKRPSELAQEPALITDGVSKFDVHQGHLGDCWFLAPLAALSTNPALHAHVSLCSSLIYGTEV
jgi:hypothetical protein